MPVLPPHWTGRKKNVCSSNPHVASCQSRSPCCSLLQQDEGGDPSSRWTREVIKDSIQEEPYHVLLQMCQLEHRKTHLLTQIHLLLH